jgi:hypothetical protein
MIKTKTVQIITAPQTIQGVKDYCPRGGQEGIFVTRSKLQRFARRLKLDAIDVIIPLPLHEQIHPDDCTAHSDDSFDSAIYWETETGSHGWCCSVCGNVIQWG